VNEARRLKELEEENRRLKHLVADLSLDKEALKAVIRKNGWRACRPKEERGVADEAISVQRTRSSLGYRTPSEFAETLKSSVMTG
jgi:hypothetical protein